MTLLYTRGVDRGPVINRDRLWLDGSGHLRVEATRFGVVVSARTYKRTP